MIRRGRQPLVGITASSATITLRVTADGSDEADCHASMAPTIEEIYDLLGVLVFGEEDDELQHAVVRLLRQQQQTVATAELATVGIVAQWLAEVPENGPCFAAGLVLPGPSALASVLDIRQPSADAMAEQVRQRYRVDYGLAVAGVETGDDGGEQIQFAVANSEGVRCQTLAVFGDQRFSRQRTAKAALNELRLQLLRSGGR